MTITRELLIPKDEINKLIINTKKGAALQENVKSLAELISNKDILKECMCHLKMASLNKDNEELDLNNAIILLKEHWINKQQNILDSDPIITADLNNIVVELDDEIGKLNDHFQRIEIIDPTHLSEDNAKFLNDFLIDDEQKPKEDRQKSFLAYNEYKFKERTFILTNQLVRETEVYRENLIFKKKKYSYNVLNSNQVGAGSFGETFISAGKLIHHQGEAAYKPHEKELIVKRISIDPDEKMYEDDIYYIKREAKFVRQRDDKKNKKNTKLVTFVRTQNAYSKTVKNKNRQYKNKQKHEAYIVMKKRGEKDLEKIISSKIENNYQLSIQEFCNLIMEACKDLQHLHKINIIHRDIKPDNMRVYFNKLNKIKKIKLIDFGLARNKNNKENWWPGNAVFQAPEMAAKDKNANEKSDVWSFGFLFKYLLKEKNSRELYDKFDGLITKTKIKNFTSKTNMNLDLSEIIDHYSADKEDDEKENIKNFFNTLGSVLNTMTDINPKKRNLDKAIKDFDVLFSNLPVSLQDQPKWITRIEKILSKIEKHIKCYKGTSKYQYVKNAINNLLTSIKNFSNNDTEKERKILDDFKVLMICCFQNKHGNGLFNNLTTETGLLIQKELSKINSKRYDDAGTTKLLVNLFGNDYGQNGVTPNYTDMVNIIFKQQADNYNATQGSDVLERAHSLIYSDGSSGRLTISRICNDEIIKNYYAKKGELVKELDRDKGNSKHNLS